MAWFSQKKKVDPATQIELWLGEINTQFKNAKSRPALEGIKQKLLELLKITSAPEFVGYEAIVMKSLRETNMNINFHNQYRELRERFLDGENETVLADLITLNRSAQHPEYQKDLLPFILDLIQSFLSRLADYLSKKSPKVEPSEDELLESPQTSIYQESPKMDAIPANEKTTMSENSHIILPKSPFQDTSSEPFEEHKEDLDKIQPETGDSNPIENFWKKSKPIEK